FRYLSPNRITYSYREDQYARRPPCYRLGSDFPRRNLSSATWATDLPQGMAWAVYRPVPQTPGGCPVCVAGERVDAGGCRRLAPVLPQRRLDNRLARVLSSMCHLRSGRPVRGDASTNATV